MLTYQLLPLCPPAMRFYRSRMLIDLRTLLSFLPEEGRLLDVGCGTGLLDYALARKRPRLEILGVDIDERAVGLARRYNALPNLSFAALPLGEVRGPFECISFVDVMHHAQEGDARRLLEDAAGLLSTAGEIVVKDISRKGGWVSYCYDRYITRSSVIRLADMEEMLRLVPQQLRPVRRLKKYRFPFPNYYLTLVPSSRLASEPAAQSGGRQRA